MNRQLYPIILICVFLAISCRKNTLEEPAQDLQQNLVHVDFKLHLPAEAGPLKTYAMAEADESVIRHVLLLAFKVSGGQETFDYCKEGMQIYEGSSANEKSFYSSLPKSEDTYRFVLLVNGSEELSDIASGIAKGTEKSVIMDQLVYTIEDNWNTASATFSPLPMWGESSVVTGINAQTIMPAIILLRSLARVDITLDNAAINDFSITSVYLYNANNKAYMAPDAGNFDPSNFIATRPSIPADAGALPEREYLPSSLNKLEREIYLFEAKKASTIGASDATALVIGGKYKDRNTATYYRVDFVDGNSPIDLVRNHNYTINIIAVSGPGLSSPDEAFNSSKSDMNVSIVQWSHTETDYVAIGGAEFTLGAPSYVNLGNNAEAATSVQIDTDYPGGWKAMLLSNPNDFITLTQANGGTGTSSLMFNCRQNLSGSLRTAVISLSAGSQQTKTITLIQSP